jgi:Leucine-rich repeat (LRR) protein
MIWGQGVWGSNSWASDQDGDLIPDDLDMFPELPIGDLKDTDGDGAPDECDQACLDIGMLADTDDDNDGVEDALDAFPLDSSEAVDTDGDGIGDNDDIDTGLTAVLDVALASCIADSGLSRLSDLKELRCGRTGVESLTGLDKFLALQHLELQENSNITDFSPLASLVNLRVLYLDRISLVGVTALRDLSLELLSVPYAGFTTLNNILPDPNTLKSLNLDGNPLADLSPLQGYLQLESLNLQSTLVDLSTLPANLPKLRELNLFYTSITSAAELPVTLATTLESLGVDSDDPNNRFDLAGFSAFPALHTLQLGGYVDWGTAAGNTSFIKTLFTGAHHLTSLTQFNGGFENVEGLLIDWSLIEDLEGIQNLTKLKWLAARNTQLKDISALERILDKLYLDGANITDISTLGPIYSDNVVTGDISLTNNPIRKVGDTLKGWQIPQVNFSNTQISCEEIEYVNSYLTPQINVTWPEPCASDPDRDYFYEEEDAFPLDPAAAVDSDQDGAPDYWNPDATDQQIAESSLTLDAMPYDPTETRDSDSDGVGDNADVFPNDAAAAVDTDGDGMPDDWNQSATAEQIAASMLTLDQDDDNDGISDAQETIDGTDSQDPSDFIPPYDDLNGVVYHWYQHSVVAGGSVDRNGVTTLTGSDGSYLFNETPEGVYDLTASLAVSEYDTNRTITSADALAALKIAVGLNPNSDPDGDGPLEALAVSPYQLIAADMNQDGRVTSADALAILKVAVGLSDALEPSWELVEDSQALWSTHSDKSNVFDASQTYALTYPDQTQVNFAAILLGDVNASWRAQEGTASLDHGHFSSHAKATGAPLSLWGIRDSDNDGLTDEQEDTLGTSPFDADSDDDGVTDREDAYPLDPDKFDEVPAGVKPEPILSASPKKADVPAITLVNPVLLRGDMNDWGEGDVFTQQEDGSYTLTLGLNQGVYTFKVATNDWAVMDLGAKDEASRLIVIDKVVQLAAHSNAAFILEVDEERELVFSVEIDSDGNAVLIVTELH